MGHYLTQNINKSVSYYVNILNSPYLISIEDTDSKDIQKNILILFSRLTFLSWKLVKFSYILYFVERLLLVSFAFVQYLQLTIIYAKTDFLFMHLQGCVPRPRVVLVIKYTPQENLIHDCFVNNIILFKTRFFSIGQIKYTHENARTFFLYQQQVSFFNA